MDRCLVLGSPRTALREAVLAGCGRHIPVQPASLAVWSTRDAARGFDCIVVVGEGSRAEDAASYYRGPERLVLTVGAPILEAERQYRLAPDPGWLLAFKRHDRRESLGVAAGPPHERKRLQRILVCGEKPLDPGHGLSGDGCRAWAANAIGKCKSLDDSDVTWRPHPLDVYNVTRADHYSDPLTESFEEALEGVWLVVVHSSTCGLEALLAGRPVIADYKSERVRPVYAELCGSFSRFKDVTAPSPDDLNELLARIADTQWTVEEIATGKPFEPFLVKEPEPEPVAGPVHFEIIKGIGPSSADKIVAAGFRTFEALCDADEDAVARIDLSKSAEKSLLEFIGAEAVGG